LNDELKSDLGRGFILSAQGRSTIIRVSYCAAL